MIVRFEKKSEKAVLTAVIVIAAIVIGICGYAATRIQVLGGATSSEVR